MSKRSGLDEYDDDFSDFEDEDEPKSLDKTSPDYRAVKATVYGGHCAWRNPKKKEKADPYLLVTFQGQMQQTQELVGTTHPKWNETFEFPIDAGGGGGKGGLGQLIIEMWDRNNKREGEKGQIFMGEVRVSLADTADVNFEYCTQRQYPLQPRSKATKTDNVKGDLTLKVGMVIPTKKKLATSLSPSNKNKERTTEQIVKEAEEVVDDSFESVKRSLKMLENTRGMGADTLDMLNTQGEQIRKIQGHVDNIEVLQDKADRHMKAINSVQGAIMNKFSSSPKQRDSNKKTDRLVEKSQKKRAKARDKEMEEEEEEKERETRHQRRNRLKNSMKGETDGKVRDMYQADFSMLSEDSREKIAKTDEGVDRMSSLLDDLKLIALETGDELDDHNMRIKQLDESLTRTNARMKSSNAKIGKKIS